MAERDELGDITDQGPWEREDEDSSDEAARDGEDENVDEDGPLEPEIETFPVPGTDPI